MPDAPDFFPGFKSRYLSTDAGRLFVRVGGTGEPLVLLHGFPQTGVCWHAIAPRLAERFTVVVPDLRGYGWSSAPASHGGEGYTKRVMGADIVSVMEQLGHGRFALAGHDRGARVGYRLALDHPGRLTRLALLDILPTVEVWRAMEKGGTSSPHWTTLSEPEPTPETTIGKDPNSYYFGLIKRWTRSNTLDAFDPRALAAYSEGWGDPTRVHATCEDYRAGAGPDRAADEADEAAGKTIGCPVLILGSTDYLNESAKGSPLSIWQNSFAPGAVGATIESGHFLMEESPSATLGALEAFLKE